MSHIHIPDGVLPYWLWILGYVIIIAVYFLVSKFVGKSNPKKIPFIGVFGALMLLSMSIPLPFPVPYHINLSVLAGIILGPVYSFFTILTVNIILAFLAHGGITVVGLNTTVIFSEALCGYFLYKFLSSKTKNVFISALVTTLISLLVSTALSISIVYAGTHNLEFLVHHHHGHHMEGQAPPPRHDADFKENEHLKVNPDKNAGPPPIVEETHEVDEMHDMSEMPPEMQDMHRPPTEEMGNELPHIPHEHFSIKKFLGLMLIFGTIGWILESLITAFVVNYINRVKPEVL